MRVSVSGAQNSFWNQTKSFCLSLGQKVYIFDENPKSTQDIIGDVYCLGKYCLNGEKCKSVGGYLTTLRSIYDCDNCGTWLFVQKVPSDVRRTRKDDKTDKTRFFSLLQKDELGTQQTIIT